MTELDCKVEGCDRERLTLGMCPAHYERVRRFGDPCADIPIGELWRSPEPPRATHRTAVTPSRYV